MATGPGIVPMELTRRALLAAPAGGISELTFEMFGARGDGLADDTAALNRGLVASAQTSRAIRGSAGARYRISPSGTKAFINPIGERIQKNVCVEVPSGAAADFSGSCLVASPKMDAIAICNSNPSLRVDRLSVRGLAIDGLLQPSSVPLVWFSGCINSEFLGLSVRNAVNLAFCFSGLEECQLDRISAQNIVGNGIALGGNTAHQIRRCKIGSIAVQKTVLFSQPHLPGNPVVIGAKETSIDSIHAADCAAGVKVTANSNVVRIRDVSVIRCVTQNSGLKIQGDADAWCAAISVANVRASRCVGSGLFIQNASGCQIFSYEGRGNGQGGKDPDIWLAGQDFLGGHLISTNPKSAGFLARPDCGNYRIHDLSVVRTIGRGGLDVLFAGGTGLIERCAASRIQRLPGAVAVIGSHRRQEG